MVKKMPKGEERAKIVAENNAIQNRVSENTNRKIRRGSWISLNLRQESYFGLGTPVSKILWLTPANPSAKIPLEVTDDQLKQIAVALQLGSIVLGKKTVLAHDVSTAAISEYTAAVDAIRGQDPDRMFTEKVKKLANTREINGIGSADILDKMITHETKRKNRPKVIEFLKEAYDYAALAFGTLYKVETLESEEVVLNGVELDKLVSDSKRIARAEFPMLDVNISSEPTSLDYKRILDQ